MPLLLRVRTLVFFAVIFNAFCVFTKDLYAPVELPISDVQAVSILAAVLSLTTVIELVNKLSVASPTGRSSPDIVVAAAVIKTKAPGTYTAEPRTEPELDQKRKEEERRQPTSDRQQRPGSKEFQSSEKKRQRSYYEKEEEVVEFYAGSEGIRLTTGSDDGSALGSTYSDKSGEAKNAEEETVSRGSRMPMPPTMLPRARGREGESDLDVPTRRSRSLPRSTGDARVEAKDTKAGAESGRSDEMWIENVSAAISERKASDAGSTTASEKQRMSGVKRRVSRSMSRLLGRRKSSTAETSGYAGGEEKSFVPSSERPAAPSSVDCDKILPKEGSTLEPETATLPDEGELASKQSGGISAITVQAGRVSKPMGVEKPASQITEQNSCLERKTLKKTEIRNPEDPVFFLDERKITLQFIPRACRTEPDQAAQQPELEYAEGEEASQKDIVGRFRGKLEKTDEQILAAAEKIRSGKIIAPKKEEEEKETEQQVQEEVVPGESAFADQRRWLAVVTVKLAKTLLCLASLLLQLVIVIAYVLPCLCDILSDRMLGNLVGIFIVVFATMYKCGGHVLGGYNVC